VGPEVQPDPLDESRFLGQADQSQLAERGGFDGVERPPPEPLRSPREGPRQRDLPQCPLSLPAGGKADRDEAAQVPELLEAGESIVAVGSGTVLHTGRLAKPRWLLVVTDRRLLCLKGKLGNRKVIKIPVNAIRSAQIAGLIGKVLILETSTGSLRVSSIKKAVAESLVMGLESVMASDDEE
jgi:hypothetical protein